MLLLMTKRDPLYYYSGAQHDMEMSLAERSNHIFNRYEVLNSQGEELARPYEEQYGTGELYKFKRSRNSDNNNYTYFYFLDNEPFETTLQVVGKNKNIMIVQDLFPDEVVHFGTVPHYNILPSDFMNIVTSVDMSSGQFSGEFTFKMTGSSPGLALA